MDGNLQTARGRRYEIASEDYSVPYTDPEGKKIVLCGRLVRPEKEGDSPAVILCHGFNGHFSDFSEECARFAASGYICYAFDFCGAQSGGESRGRTASEYTPFTMKEDLCAAIGALKTLPGVDGERIFLFGGSQGGLIAALTAADDAFKDAVAAVALYFPAFNIPDDWRTRPIAETPLMGYSVGANYVRSVRGLDPFAVIGNYRGDVCLVWGDRDELVPRKYIDRAVAVYGKDRTELTVIEGAGHGFSGAAREIAAVKTLDFFERHIR